jgi:hypothetical protein
MVWQHGLWIRKAVYIRGLTGNVILDNVAALLSALWSNIAYGVVGGNMASGIVGQFGIGDGVVIWRM